MIEIMSVLLPVIELPDVPANPLWQVAGGAGWQYFELHGGLSEPEIGSVMYALARDSRPERLRDQEWHPQSDQVHEVLGWIANAELLNVPGGPRAEDGGGGRTDPGCCCDLNDWRAWVPFPERPGLWLGHSPEPWIEYRDTTIRVHQEGGSVCEPSAEGFVEIALADMPGLLLGVQQRLEGFLHAVRQWVAQISPSLADPVVGSLDRHLDVCRPLSLT